MTKYLNPYIEEARDITRRQPGCSLSICSCGKNHTWINEPGVIAGIPKWLCKTPASWSGSIKKLLNDKAEVKPLEDAKTLILTPKEEALIRYARSTYEAPPDKNIIAALMMTQWIRAQRMPFESDRLIELYDAPKKKGIV